MNLLNDKFAIELKEICELASKNNNQISITLVLDIMKEKNESLDNFNEVLNYLRSNNIDLLQQESDEDYDEGNRENKGDPYTPADVNIIPRSLTIESIIGRLEHDEIDLTPDFQRKGDLWTKVQQSRLIESMMLKIPLPTFYFNATDDNKWVVIDGLQRLTALKNFFVKKTLTLQGLEFLVDFNGHKVDDLPRHYYRRIRETQIHSYTIEKGTPEEITYNIFKRINTGGLKLEPQEIRHALYRGRATTLIKELASTKEFKEATDFSISSLRMLDCEYITRFIAFIENDFKNDYKSNVDDYLILAMKRVNKYSDDELERIKKKFIRTMIICYRIFGRYTFRKIGDNGRRGPVNKAIFEMWSIVISKLDNNESKKLIDNKSIVVNKFTECFELYNFNSWLRSSDKNSIENRVNKVYSIVGSVIND